MTDEINKAAEALKNGKVILYLTDTFWAIGCDVRNTEAVTKIHQLKKREPLQPFVVLIHDIGQLHDYVQKVPDIAWDIVEFAERPLTIIYPKGKNVAPGLLGADGSIAVQLVRNEFCKKLINRLGRAIVCTSANLHKQPKPGMLQEIDAVIKKGVDYIVNPDNLPQPVKPPKLATIFRLELNGQITFIRK
jgi:L-threonylcarbamoyladenylate synthase